MAANIRKGLLQFVFSGSYMKRWNDKLRPVELMEIDKQSHKMIVAWILCRLQKGLSAEERVRLELEVIEGGIFDYLFRLVITDIKPPIFYRIKSDAGQYESLARWAVSELAPHIGGLGEEFGQKLEGYILSPKKAGAGGRILAAAHLYASVWEFRLIKMFNAAFDEEMADIESMFDRQLEGYRDLPGMEELLQGLPPLDAAEGGGPRPRTAALGSLANLCGRLRFQKRWSQTPRTPETSVMGHMFLVACYSYFMSMSLGACDARTVNNFFCGLFHDLPEMLTRDIISPVKKSSDAISRIIAVYEKEELERRVFDPLESENYHGLSSRLKYYLGIETGSEFHNTIIKDGKVQALDFETFHRDCNEDRLDPKDGTAIKSCDTLAAYLEAYTAIRNGITSDQIQQAFWRMRKEEAGKILGNVHVGALFTDFD